jgi:hypothetical protein
MLVQVRGRNCTMTIYDLIDDRIESVDHLAIDADGASDRALVIDAQRVAK